MRKAYTEVQQVADDRLSGSTQVLDDLIELLIRLLSVKGNLPELTYLEGALRMVCDQHPELLVLQHFSTSFIEQMHQQDLSSAAGWLADYRERWQNHPCRIADSLRGELGPGAETFLLHSYSGTVVSVLKEWKRRKVEFNTIQTESRPGLEGRVQAEKLMAAGIPTRLIIDLDAARYMERVDAVLLGADQYDRQYVVNKTGSKALVILANAFDKPVYVLTDERKMVQVATAESTAPSDEVWKDHPPGITIENRYFEKIRLDSVRLITE